MASGGSRPGAGRPPGAINKLAREAAEKAAATGVMPLDYLLGIMRDVGADEAKRIDCAKAAAPYVHPKLANIDLSATDGTLAEAVAYAWQPSQPSPR